MRARARWLSILHRKVMPRNMPPCIIRKSDGAALYATSDLATIIEREKDFAAGPLYLCRR